MKKGLYEVFTGIFFIMIALIALFLWLFISGTTTLIKAEEGAQRLSISTAREAFTSFVRCNGAVVSEDTIAGCLAVERDFVKAILVEQVALGACEERVWNAELFEQAVLDTNTNSYPYWIVIQSGAHNCLAKVIIAV